MNKSKATIIISQIIEKVEKIVGICIALFCGFLCVFSMFDDSPDPIGVVVFFWIICALGVLLFLAGLKRKKMRLEFKKYVTQLSIDPSGSLENLASATGMSVDVVKKNLKYLIKKKFFADAFINEQENRLVLPAMAPNVGQTMQSQQKVDSAELVACTCPYCGGKNMIAKGKITECDFCGSPLQG